MEEIPILNMEQIEELAQMVKGIQLDNRKDLDSILAQSVDIQYTTIINLYNLTVQAWESKQKTIDNLCHFTLTMMNTVQYLWERQYEQQDKISNAEIVIGSLERNIGDLNEENKQIKNRMSEAEIQLNNVAGERDRIEEMYRSASCIAFESEKQLKELDLDAKKCSACIEIKSEINQGQQVNQKIKQKVIEQKDDEISSLKEEKRRLQEQFQQLKEEHELTRLEVELAEIAIKDALIYKESYISVISQIQEGSVVLPDKLDQKLLKHYKSEPVQFCPLNSNILSNQFPENIQEPQDLLGLQLDTKIQKEEQSSDLSLIRLDKKQEKKTTYQTPFRKKGAHLYESDHQEEERQQSFEESAIYKKEGVVIFQSNTDFTISSNHEDSREPTFSQYQPSSRVFCSSIGKQKHNNNDRAVPSRRNNTVNVHMKKPKPYVPSDRQFNESRDSSASQTTINKLYNYISTKLISKRIRKH